MYTREEVHDIFSPETVFQPQGGSWGISGIIGIPNRMADWVFFVTFGSRQGAHSFDESITTDGVLTWQSQPRQRLGDPQIRQFMGTTTGCIRFTCSCDRGGGVRTHIAAPSGTSVMILTGKPPSTSSGS
jgi:hypothetical protein